LGRRGENSSFPRLIFFLSKETEFEITDFANCDTRENWGVEMKGSA